MNIKKNEVKIAIAALVLVVYALGLSTLTQVIASIQTSRSISNQGTLKAVGVGVYWDAGLTSAVSSIDWGILEPDSSVSKTVYIRNEGNSAAVLDMTTSNWNPSSAATYMTLSWDYGGQSLDVGDVVQVELTLSVSSNIAGIDSFSFDITITASG